MPRRSEFFSDLPLFSHFFTLYYNPANRSRFIISCHLSSHHPPTLPTSSWGLVSPRHFYFHCIFFFSVLISPACFFFFFFLGPSFACSCSTFPICCTALRTTYRSVSLCLLLHFIDPLPCLFAFLQPRARASLVFAYSLILFFLFFFSSFPLHLFVGTLFFTCPTIVVSVFIPFFSTESSPTPLCSLSGVVLCIAVCEDDIRSRTISQTSVFAPRIHLRRRLWVITCNRARFSFRKNVHPFCVRKSSCKHPSRTELYWSASVISVQPCWSIPYHEICAGIETWYWYISVALRQRMRLWCNRLISFPPPPPLPLGAQFSWWRSSVSLLQSLFPASMQPSHATSRLTAATATPCASCRGTTSSTQHPPAILPCRRCSRRSAVHALTRQMTCVIVVTCSAMLCNQTKLSWGLESPCWEKMLGVLIMLGRLWMLVCDGVQPHDLLWHSLPLIKSHLRWILFQTCFSQLKGTENCLGHSKMSPLSFVICWIDVLLNRLVQRANLNHHLRRLSRHLTLQSRPHSILRSCDSLLKERLSHHLGLIPLLRLTSCLTPLRRLQLLLLERRFRQPRLRPALHLRRKRRQVAHPKYRALHLPILPPPVRTTLLASRGHTIRNRTTPSRPTNLGNPILILTTLMAAVPPTVRKPLSDARTYASFSVQLVRSRRCVAELTVPLGWLSNLTDSSDARLSPVPCACCSDVQAFLPFSKRIEAVTWCDGSGTSDLWWLFHSGHSIYRNFDLKFFDRLHYIVSLLLRNINQPQ